MSSPRIKNIIFDLGNTLIFFDYCYFYDGVARLEKKLNANKFRKFIIDKKLDIKLATARIDHKGYFRHLKKQFDLKISYADFIYLYCNIFWENTDMRKFMEELVKNKKYKVFLLSNIDTTHYTYLCKNFPFFRLIKNQVLSYKVRSVKPEKKIFKHILEKYKLDPAETCLIDDMRLNIKAAEKLGIQTFHYTSHKRFLKEFKKAAA